MTECYNENVIEWIKGQEIATLTLTQEKLKNRVAKLAESKPDCVDYILNADGTMLAHLPAKWIRISPPRELSEEQRLKYVERGKMLQTHK